MSNPIRIVRKIKNAQNKKLDLITESTSKLQNMLSEDVRINLSKSFGTSQSNLIIKKSRSSSQIKQKLAVLPSNNATPLNKKIRNISHLVGSTSEINENYTSDKTQHNSIETYSKNITFLEKSLQEQLKNQTTGKKINICLETLHKISSFDIRFKNIIEIVTNEIGKFIENHSETHNLNEIITQKSHKIEQLNQQIIELNNFISDVTSENKNLVKKLKDTNHALTFMKKKGVPIEQYFKEFNEDVKKKKSISSEGNSCKSTDVVEKLAMIKSIPKLNVLPPSENGFHQEFMSKINEFSDSWRELIKREKSST